MRTPKKGLRMKTSSRAAVLTGVGAAAAAVVGRLVVARRKADSRDEHWLAVTVHCSPDRLHDLPEPLAELRQDVELRIRPATGDKGTELLARPVGDVSREDLRVALRQTKSLIETGSVLRPDPPATHPGPAGRVLRLVTSRAAGEGRL